MATEMMAVRMIHAIPGHPSRSMNGTSLVLICRSCSRIMLPAVVAVAAEDPVPDAVVAGGRMTPAAEGVGFLSPFSAVCSNRPARPVSSSLSGVDDGLVPPPAAPSTTPAHPCSKSAVKKFSARSLAPGHLSTPRPASAASLIVIWARWLHPGRSWPLPPLDAHCLSTPPPSPLVRAVMPRTRGSRCSYVRLRGRRRKTKL